jgi:hypothetical protein
MFFSPVMRQLLGHFHEAGSLIVQAQASRCACLVASPSIKRDNPNNQKKTESKIYALLIIY